MNVILILLPITLCLVMVSLAGYFWATAHGQYDDLDTPAHRILFDDIQERIPRNDDSAP